MIQPRFITTGIGSMPFADPEAAVDMILKTCSTAPFWPQLPSLDLNEQMEIQYSEGLPCVVIDRIKNRMYFNTAGDTSDALAGFYEKYMLAMDPDSGNGDCSSMAISPNFAHGFHAFLNRLKAKNLRFPIIKCQTTGPCSFTLTIVDENKRAIYYNEEFRQVIIKAMAMKCRWQIQTLKPYADQIICSVDEPILSAFGSSTYVSVTREDVVAALKEVIDAIHKENALAMIHCCGNTEWSILVDAGVDIISFDAFEYGDTIAIYPDAIKTLLNRGGILAWGIIPTSVKLHTQTAETLVTKLTSLIDALGSKGIEKQKIAEQSVITPSCGTGTMKVEEAQKTFEVINQVAAIMKKNYRFI